MTAIALRSPAALQADALADQLPALVEMIGALDDVATVKEWADRGAAIETYLKATRQNIGPAQTFARMAEMRIGELLGPAVIGVNQHSEGSNAIEPSLSPDDRYQFRLLAEHRALVEPLLPAPRSRLLKFIREQAARRDSAPIESPPEATLYPTIVIDPPWRYENGGTRNAARDHYETMTIAELEQLVIPAADNAHLYLWVTNNFLAEGLNLCSLWGFNYKTLLTWVKPQMGMGNYFRSVTEHVIFGVRGSLPTERRDRTNVILADRTEHSAKPDAFYDLVKEMSPGPYMEMFARKRRLGWSVWGNEA